MKRSAGAAFWLVVFLAGQGHPADSLLDPFGTALKGARALDRALGVRQFFQRDQRRRAPGVELWVYDNRTEDGRGSEGLILDLWVGLAYRASAHPNKALRKMTTPEQLRDLLRDYQRRGVRIQRLVVSAHGTPGDGGLITRGSLAMLKEYRGVFAPGAQIDFRTCRTGAGNRGAAFLREVGEALLGENGGSVRAPRGDFVEGPLGGARGGTQTYQVRAGGGGQFADGLTDEGELRRLTQAADALERLLNDNEQAIQGLGLEREAGMVRTPLRLARDFLSRNPFTLREAAEAEENLQFARDRYDRTIAPRLRERAAVACF